MIGIDTYTKLMLHCNGSNGSTTFTDSSLYAHPVTAHGNAHLTTATSKFGGASGVFDGSNNTMLTVLDSVDWYFGGTNLCIDFWVKFNSTTSNPILVSQIASPTNCWYLQYDSGTIKFAEIYSSTTDLQFHFNFTPTLSTWYHIAITRNGGIFRGFIDGVIQTLILDAGSYSTTLHDFAASLYIGGWYDGYSNMLDGNLDEIRISNNIARWLATFTPPASEYTKGKIAGQAIIGGVYAMGATVRMTNQDSPITTVWVTTTDSNGYFQFIDNLLDTNFYHVMIEYTSGGTKYNAKSLWNISPFAY